MEENDSSHSEHSFDLAPAITLEIQQLAESLKETNENLYTFQFMLNQYKKLARVVPQVQSSDFAVAVDKNAIIEDELKKISQSIQQLEAKDETHFQEIKLHLNQQPKALNKLDTSELKEVISELTNKLSVQEDKCVALTEANLRLTHELASEKERSLILDQKLESEREAARVVGRDVQRYVEYNNKLEMELKSLRESENRRNNQSSSNNDVVDGVGVLNESSNLCTTCLDEDEKENSLQNVVSKVQKIAEHIEKQNVQLVEELRNSRSLSSRGDQPVNKELATTVTNSKKIEFAEILAERNSLHVINEKLTQDIDKLNQEVEIREAKYQNLKSKSKLLLNKYRAAKSSGSVDKLKNAKRVLIDLQNLFIAKDKNHLILMNYFGSQIEIIGRIISAFAGHQYKGPVLGVEGHKKLTMWFTSVHSVNIWCQKEILSLGTILTYYKF